jgi:alpha-1,6-mannosyltransferase
MGNPTEARPKTTAARASRSTALAALGLLGVVYVALAVLWAHPGSNVVLATSGGSPGWLLGPFRGLGAGFADGGLGGPLFYALMWVSMLAYCALLATARSVSPRAIAGAIVGAHVLFALAPPLLSQDVFSYISYARLDVLHGLDPYTHSPADVPGDAVFPYAGSKDFTSVYGPLFTVATFPLAKTSVPFAFWALKAVAALASLLIVALVWWCARRLGRDPRLAAAVVGLNPLVLVHVVGGAHNDALTVLLWMGGVAALLATREALGGGLTAAGGAVKVSAAVLGPFMLIGAHRRALLLAGAAAGALAALAVAAVAFGDNALEAFALLGDNQDRTSRWSLPQRSADAIAAITSGSAGEIVDYTRALFGVALIALVAYLLRAAWRTRDRRGAWIAPAGWATLGVLATTAWLVPWYAIWLLPLAALGSDRRLLVATIVLCAYMMVIAMPLEPFSPY